MQIPHQIFNICLEKLNELERLGVIDKSLSQSNSPAFPMRKKNGKMRIFVDFRELKKNKTTTVLFSTINNRHVTTTGRFNYIYSVGSEFWIVPDTIIRKTIPRMSFFL
ncbi:Pro-Pol polyprotein [Dictyocoela roeselum]|nr:Pro-Pol polyprotein [Dictyocoela roeselum]